MYAYIGGDTHTAGAAIAAPLRIMGQQPIQNAVPTQWPNGASFFT